MPVAVTITVNVETAHSVQLAAGISEGITDVMTSQNILSKITSTSSLIV